MRVKLGSSFQLRNSYSSRVSNAKLRRSYRSSSTSSDASSSGIMDVFRGTALSRSRSSLRRRFKTSSNNIKISGGNSLTNSSLTVKDEYKDKAVANFKVINKAKNELEDRIPEWLKEAGVPKSVKFEFDYNIDTQKAEVTKISDEKYRESVESVLNENIGKETLYTAYASRIMNGYISSAYYSSAAKSLESCFGQDIDELSLDKNGNIIGANANLQRAIKAQKRGREYTSISSRRFPSDDIEGLLKRLLSDKKITDNVSHMGYDGGSVYTNDGKFKLGKSFDSSVFNDKRYAARGSIALASAADYDGWLKNEEKFK